MKIYEKLKTQQTVSIIICGVGGQGIILSGKVIGHLLISQNFEVKISSIHGMAQRGGSVSNFVRFGSTVYSPLIPEGGCDIIVSMEYSEILNYLKYLTRHTKIILSDFKIRSLADDYYPKNIEQELKRNNLNFKIIPLSERLKEIPPKFHNIACLAALSKKLPFSLDAWMNSLEHCIPEKYLKLNINVFKKMREA